jgi:hypothetical protein
MRRDGLLGSGECIVEFRILRCCQKSPKITFQAGERNFREDPSTDINRAFTRDVKKIERKTFAWRDHVINGARAVRGTGPVSVKGTVVFFCCFRREAVVL